MIFKTPKSPKRTLPYEEQRALVKRDSQPKPFRGKTPGGEVSCPHILLSDCLPGSQCLNQPGARGREPADLCHTGQSPGRGQAGEGRVESIGKGRRGQVRCLQNRIWARRHYGRWRGGGGGWKPFCLIVLEGSSKREAGSDHEAP